MDCAQWLCGKEPVLWGLAEALGRAVAGDPRLSDCLLDDEDLGEEMELLSPDAVDPDTFHWELHQERIISFLVKAIRNYAFNHERCGKVDRSGNETKAMKANNGIVKRPSWQRMIEKTYAKIVKMVAHSKDVWKEKKLFKKRKESKILNDLSSKQFAEMETQLNLLRRELQAEGEKVVDGWLDGVRPEEKDAAERCGLVLVQREVERAARRLRAEVQTPGRLAKDAAAREARAESLRRALRRRQREAVLRRRGQRRSFPIHIYRKWRAKKRKKLRRDARKLNQTCDECKMNDIRLWREGEGRLHLEQLSLEDARRLQGELFRSGEMGVLVDYLAILLKRPAPELLDPPSSPADTRDSSLGGSRFLYRDTR